MAPTGDPVRYEKREDPPGWWRQGVDALPWTTTEVDGTVLWYTKNGACPRCLHPDGIGASVEAEGWLGLGPRDSGDIFVRCGCTGDHDRPEGALHGCGWGAYVAGPVPGGSP